MMGFIAYAHNLNDTIKLQCMSKYVAFINSSTDKNRIFVTGNAMMSTKLSSSKQAIEKALNQLEEHQALSIPMIRRCHMLDRQERTIRIEKNSLPVNSIHGPLQIISTTNPNVMHSSNLLNG